MTNDHGSPDRNRPPDPSRNPYATPDKNAPAPAAKAPLARDHKNEQQHGNGQQPPERAGKKPPLKVPDKEELKETGRAVAWFGGAMLATLLSAQLPLPYGVVTPVLGIATIWLGIRTILRSRRISTRNLLTPMAIVGVVLALLLTFAGASRLILWPIEMQKQECLRLAITNSAQAQCTSQYDDALQDRLDSLRGG